MIRHFRVSAAVVAVVLLCAGCRNDGGTAIPPDTIVVVGSECLTRSMLSHAMPPALSQADSTAFARAYIRTWIEGQLITNVATADVDMAEIDRLTDEYRRELIMSNYRRAMSRRHDDTPFADDSLQAYYEDHKADYVLERPLVKGIYLKVPADNPALAQLRHLYRSSKPQDLDKLEKTAPGNALHYDYFLDTWVDWEQIENRIPADFTADRMAQIASGRPFEFTDRGYVYLLRVDDWLDAGSVMPLEAARPLVRERLLVLRRKDLDSHLLEELMSTSIADGTVVFPGRNPLN